MRLTLRSLIPAVLVLAACGELTTTPTAALRGSSSLLTVWGPFTAVENELRVCGFALNGGPTPENPGTAVIAVSGVTAAEGLISPLVTVGHATCATVWMSPLTAGDNDQFNITLTQVGPAGFHLYYAPYFYSNAGDGNGGVISEESGIGCSNGTDPMVCTSVTITVSRAVGATVIFKQTAGETPHETCGGLTPGYWKNWRNHYTAAQFNVLLQGTIAGSIAQADAIFADKGSNATAKLRWFVLAHQLTFNLMTTTFPNPSGGNLTATCSEGLSSGNLGTWMTAGLNILNGVGGPYSEAYILQVKSALDVIANLGGG